MTQRPVGQRQRPAGETRKYPPKKIEEAWHALDRQQNEGLIEALRPFRQGEDAALAVSGNPYDRRSAGRLGEGGQE
jgi:hypothetical protein